jgi:hypothetical protein
MAFSFLYLALQACWARLFVAGTAYGVAGDVIAGRPLNHIKPPVSLRFANPERMEDQ